MDEFFTLGSPYCLLCGEGECKPEVHERYNKMVQADNEMQQRYLEENRKDNEANSSLRV